jgi:histidyl-tRNA synthetase
MGKVFRGERPQAGRFREFYQCDIDVVDNGQLDLQFDAEISSIIYTIFQKLGFKNFTIRINNRKIFDGLFAELGITKKSSNIMQAIDKLEKVGNEAVKNELKKLLLSPEVVERIFNFIGLKGSSDNVIAGLQSLGIDNIQFKNGVKELVKVVSLIKQFGVPESNFTVDLTIARGLDYYTGTVYETFLDDYPEIGSVCSGGRYDNLISHYTSRKISGVGISIGLTRLFNQLYKKGILQTSEPTLTKVLVLPMTEDVKYSLEIATKLRKNGISTEISFVQGKMKKRLRYADRLGIPYVVFIGEDEIRKGVYTLRDLVTGNQKELGERELLTKFSKK